MASWKNDEDIARDLDILSGIRSPEGKVKSYSSWGRGQIAHVETSYGVDEFPAQPDKTLREEFEWFPEKTYLEKFPDSISRGKKLEILKENCYRDKELEVHEQLRAAVGPGHSNALIEASFKQRLKLGLKNDQETLPKEQFEDFEETGVHPTYNSILSSSNSILNSSETIGEHKNIIPESTELMKHPKDEVSKETKRKRKPRQYRNALLESLKKINDSENSLAFEHSKPDGPIFGNKQSNIPPAGYLPGNSCSLSFEQEKSSENSFEYKETDFPALQKF